MKPCPNCAEQIPDHGDYCPYCKRDLTTKPAARTPAPAARSYHGLTSLQYLGLGVLTMALGGLITSLTGAALPFFIIGGIGGFFVTVASIGLGVAAGLAQHDANR